MRMRLERSVGDLWFRRRPVLATAIAVALFAAVFVLQLSAGGPTEAYSMLYVLPVSLLAIAFGVRGGAAGGLTGLTLTVAWAVADDVDPAPLAWVARAVPMLALGLLLGYATDRAVRAETRQRQVEAAALLHQQAIEINDSLIQGLATARWALDGGRVDEGRALLDETISGAQTSVSDLIRRAGMDRRAASLDGGPDPRAPQAPAQHGRARDRRFLRRAG